MSRRVRLPRWLYSARLRLLACVLLGVVPVAIAWPLSRGEASLALLIGLLALSTAFVTASGLVMLPMNADDTEVHATREDFSPFADNLIIVLVELASILGIVVLMFTSHSGSGRVIAAVALCGAFTSWAMLHTTYAARYGRYYYADDGSVGGIDFNDDVPPRYTDFYYFSFNLGMTFQVSDTAVTTGSLRTIVLGHCVLSYLFNTIILAATINLVTGIVTG